MSSAYRKVEQILKYGTFDDHASRNQKNDSYLRKIQGKPFAEVLEEENKKREAGK